MQRRIIFKLRDDLDDASVEKIIKSTRVPDRYSSELTIFRGSEPQVGSDRVDRRINPFIDLLERTETQLGTKSNYLFRHTPLGAFSKFKMSLTTQNSRYNMPNFYFAFDSEVPRDFSERELKQILSRFKRFLPQKGANIQTSAHLLECAYIKYENLATGAEFLPDAEKKGNQDYLDSIEHKETRVVTLEETWVGIVEKWGWNTAHQAFDNTDGRINLVSLPQYSTADKKLRELLEKQKSSDDEPHGTKTLGILASNSQPAGDAIRGILPSNVKIALSSCIVKLDEDAKTLYDADGFYEENALSKLINYYSHNTLSNQVILVEIATRMGLPITTECIMAHLVELASQLGHTVVIPAGNRIDTANIDFGFGTWDVAAPYLLVGAYETVSDGTLQVRNSTNWGKKNVRIFAQGFGVLTTHNAKSVKRLDASDNNLYDSMGFTSAASAIVAGVVGLLQAYARSKKPKGRALTPTEMKDLLETSKGTPVTRNGEVVGRSIDVEEAKKRVDTLLAGG